MNCRHRFTTYERIEFVTITVIKRDGKKEPFNKSKLLRGIIRSCEKTGIEVSKLEAFVNQIEVKLQGRCQREITSAEIGEIVLSKLSVLVRLPISVLLLFIVNFKVFGIL